MPTSINPFVLFVGPSPSNSPPLDDNRHRICGPYDLPTVGVPHSGLYVGDGRHYWTRVRELGASIVRSRCPEMDDHAAHALLGQLNFGVGQYGSADRAPMEPAFCTWVPRVILQELRPAYVLLFGLGSWCQRAQNGPFEDYHIDWRKPHESFPLFAYIKAQYLS